MHTNPDVLALIALGEHAGTQAERVHAGQCFECDLLVSELTRVAEIGRRLGDGAIDPPARPDPRVWDRINADLQLA